MIFQTHRYYSEIDQKEYILSGGPGAYILTQDKKRDFPITDDAAAEFITLASEIEHDCE
jgi:hypothetical protein